MRVPFQRPQLGELRQVHAFGKRHEPPNCGGVVKEQLLAELGFDGWHLWISFLCETLHFSGYLRQNVCKVIAALICLEALH